MTDLSSMSRVSLDKRQREAASCLPIEPSLFTQPWVSVKVNPADSLERLPRFTRLTRLTDLAKLA